MIDKDLAQRFADVIEARARALCPTIDDLVYSCCGEPTGTVKRRPTYHIGIALALQVELDRLGYDEPVDVLDFHCPKLERWNNDRAFWARPIRRGFRDPRCPAVEPSRTPPCICQPRLLCLLIPPGGLEELARSIPPVNIQRAIALGTSSGDLILFDPVLNIFRRARLPSPFLE